MNFQNVIVTGANRGIGLEFVKQFLKLNDSPKNLIATTRKTSTELENLKSSNPNLHILTYDATNYEKYDDFVKQVQNIVQNDGVDLLINNAGFALRQSLETVTPKDILDNVNVNVCAPLMLTKALLPLLKASSDKRRTLVANISSRLGSIAENDSKYPYSGSLYPYRVSKCAMNMVSKTLSVDLKGDKIIVLSLHPGWVKTDLGGPNAMIDTLTSITGMLKVIHDSNMEISGSFIAYDGNVLPY